MLFNNNLSIDQELSTYLDSLIIYSIFLNILFDFHL